MTTRHHIAWIFLMGATLGMGCGSDGEEQVTPGDPDASAAGTGGGTAGSGGGTAGSGGGTAGSGGGTSGSGGGIAGSGGGIAGTGGGTAGAGPCVKTTCQGHEYQCGDCIDNDNDGVVDMQDIECLNPCDNSEDGLEMGIPGGNSAPCKADCYYDQDTGSGNDDCYWDHTCDPLSVAPDYNPEGPDCPYTSGDVVIPPTGKTCDELFDDQEQSCLDFCIPLIPNGCDCFGCCDIPGGSGNYVWLGSWDDVAKEYTCNQTVVNDEDLCRPCTPVPGCFNDCGRCEFCLGKTTLPPDCYGTGGAGGGGGAGGSGGGTAGAGGDPCGGQICPPGREPCGLACQPPCPDGQFCLTGCCANIPS